MKKVLMILAVSGMFAFASCSEAPSDVVDGADTNSVEQNDTTADNVEGDVEGDVDTTSTEADTTSTEGDTTSTEGDTTSTED